MEKVSIQRDGVRSEGLHDAFNRMRGEGWGDRFVLQAEGLTVSRKAPLAFCTVNDQPY